VGRCALGRNLFLTLGIGSHALLVIWWSQQGWGVSLVAACVTWLAACLIAWRSFKAQVGLLVWDGEIWCWQGSLAGELVQGRPEVVFDLQRTLLLRWQPLDVSPSVRAVNLWLSAESAPDFWQDLRRAVYAQDNRL
jgi:hypothetical protein